jgi:hypothetical protein
MGKTKDLGAFEWGVVVGARRTGLSVSRTGTLLGFSCSTVSCVYQEWSTTQRISSQLDTNVGSIGVTGGWWHLNWGERARVNDCSGISGMVNKTHGFQVFYIPFAPFRPLL